MRECPKCRSNKQQVKNGFNRSGSQRWRSQNWGKRDTAEPNEMGYADEVRHKAVKFYVDGMNYRRIARHLEVDHKSVMNGVKAYTAQLPPAPVPRDVNNAEMDELFTFVGSKKQSLSDDDCGSDDELHARLETGR